MAHFITNQLTKRAGYAIASAVVTVSVLWFILSSISVGDIVQLIREADRRYVAFFVIGSLVGVFFRAMRYQLFLSASGYHVPVTVMYLVVLVRNFCVDLLPARMGSLIYVAVITTKLKVPIPAAVASWAHEIIFDVIALAPLVIAAGFSVTSQTTIRPTTLIGLGILLSIAFFGALWLLPQILGLIAQWMTRLTHKKAEKGLLLREPGTGHETSLQKINKLILGCRDEVIRCRQSGIYGQIIALSVLVRLCKYISLYLFLVALLKPIGYSSETLPPGLVFFGILSAELTATLPISGIAGIGAYQGMWIAVFTMLGLPLDVAKLTSISHHLFTQAYAYTLGLFGASLLALPLISASKKHSFTRNSLDFKFQRTILLALLLAGCAGFSSNYLLAQTTETVAPGALKLKDEASEALRTLGADLVFDSNISGTFGIYRTSFAKGEILPVYDSHSHEMFPDPSPDGKSIVYAESLSLQREAPSKIFRLNLQGGNPELITENGTFPTFSADGRSVFFERERRSVWEHDLQTGVDRQIFPTPQLSFSKEVVKPRVSVDRRYLYFTSSTPKRWSTWQLDLRSQQLKFMAPGCEAAPGKKPEEMVWVKTDKVLDGSGVYSLTSPGNQASKLVDLGPPRGHEYFPSYACDARLLLWSAASPGQHSHETADYQVFIRSELVKTIAQITDNGATNRWPKVILCP